MYILPILTHLEVVALGGRSDISPDQHLNYASNNVGPVVPRYTVGQHGKFVCDGLSKACGHGHRSQRPHIVAMAARKRRNTCRGWIPSLRGPETHPLAATPFRGALLTSVNLSRPAGAF